MENTGEKSKIAYGILAILLGGLGVHKFYMGQIGMGFLFLCALSWNVGGILGLVSGIMALTKSDEEFHQHYVVGKAFL